MCFSFVLRLQSADKAFDARAPLSGKFGCTAPNWCAQLLMSNQYKLETIEAEVVFLARLAGQRREGQTEGRNPLPAHA